MLRNREHGVVAQDKVDMIEEEIRRIWKDRALRTSRVCDPAPTGDILFRLRPNRVPWLGDAPADQESALAESPDATAVLLEATDGAAGAADRLLDMVYGGAPRLAGNFLWREGPDHTLQATELVHEAYQRMIDHTRCEWRNRAHFMAVAAVARGALPRPLHRWSIYAGRRNAEVLHYPVRSMFSQGTP